MANTKETFSTIRVNFPNMNDAANLSIPEGRVQFNSEGVSIVSCHLCTHHTDFRMRHTTRTLLVAIVRSLACMTMVSVGSIGITVLIFQ